MNSVLLIKDLEKQKVKCEIIPIEGAGHTPAGHMDEFAEDIAHFLYMTLSD